MERIKAQPTDGLSYNATEPTYWNREGLDKEIERVFDICNGCRLCFNLCPSFPALFDAAEKNNGEVRGMDAAQKQEVIDLCYNCKICELKCPYTTRDEHPFQLDFARLMMRAKVVNAKEHGVALRDRMLGNPDLLGGVGSLTPGLANWSCRNTIQRAVMEKLLGIHRDKKLPDFADETVEKWVSRHPLPAAPANPSAKVVLFPTCFNNYYNPGPAKAAVEVFSRNNVEVTCTKQNCCGMPALDGGDIEFARKQARSNIVSMLPYVRRGYKIAAINPTCSMTMKKEYLDILEGEDVREYAAAVVDPNELLWNLRREPTFDRGFRTTPGKVAYHVPCHLRTQQIGLRSRDMMRLIPGTEIATVEACTAHDGTWAMKREYFELSMKYGKKVFDGMTEAEPNIMATDCPLAAIQIEQGTGTRPIHPIEILARAYRDDGFPNKVPPPEPAAT